MQLQTQAGPLCYTAPKILILLDSGYVVKHLANIWIVIVYPMAFAVSDPALEPLFLKSNFAFSCLRSDLVFRRGYSIKSWGKGLWVTAEKLKHREFQLLGLTLLSTRSGLWVPEKTPQAPLQRRTHSRPSSITQNATFPQPLCFSQVPHHRDSCVVPGTSQLQHSSYL